jgi:hypothetical protein
MGVLGRRCRPGCRWCLPGRSRWHLLGRLRRSHAGKATSRFRSGIVEPGSVPCLRRATSKGIELVRSGRCLRPVIANAEIRSTRPGRGRRRKGKLWRRGRWLGISRSGKAIGIRCSALSSMPCTSGIVFGLLHGIAQDLMCGLDGLKLRHKLDFATRISIWVILFRCCH